jgi:phage shock protein E
MRTLISTLAVAAIAATTVLAQLAPGRIEIAEFKSLQTAKKVLVVDVRDDQSFAAGHIPGAINIPLGEEERAEHLNRLKAEKRPIVTYCA